MRLPEQHIVPGLGVIVLLAVFVLASTGYFAVGYLVVLGILGAAAIGTYFMPPEVQVEVRIALAVLGLLALFVMSRSFGFWLALLAFLAIGAIQIPHRGTLSRSLHTVAWLNALRAGQGVGATDTGDGGSEGAGEANTRMSPGIGASGRVIGRFAMPVMGVIVLLSFLLPWLTASISLAGDSVGGVVGNLVGANVEDLGHKESISGLQLVELSTEAAGYRGFNEDLSFLYIVPVIAGVIAILAVLGAASVFLPRAVAMAAGTAGVIVMIILGIGFFAAMSEIKSGEIGAFLELASAFGADLNVSLGAGYWLTTMAFLVMAVLPWFVWPKKNQDQPVT